MCVQDTLARETAAAASEEPLDGAPAARCAVAVARVRVASDLQVGGLCGGRSCCWRTIFRVTQRGHIGHRRPALAGRLVRRTRSGDTLSSASRRQQNK